MKKITILLITLLLSTAGHAKFYKAIVYLTDGTPKTGLAELVEDTDSKVSFKTDENAKTEKIASDDILQIVYTYDSGAIITMEYLYMVGPGVFSSKISKSKKKVWFNIIYSKNYKIGRIDNEGSVQPYHAASSSYYFEKKKSDQLVFGFNSLGNVAKSYGTDARMKKMAQEAFADCPKIIDAIEKETFTLETALNQMIAIFEKIKCN